MNKNILLFALAVTALFSCEEDENNDTIIFPDHNNHLITALVFDNSNTLWVGTDSGLFRSHTKSFKLVDIKIDEPVTALAFEEKDHILWVGTRNGLSEIDLYSEGFNSDTISADLLSNDSINSIYIDSGSDKWFGTKSGITLNSAGNWKKDKFKKNLSGTVTDIVFQKTGINSIAAWDGDYFFATNGRNVYRAFNWDETADAFTGATQWLNPYNGSAITDTMYVVFIDSKGRQWFGGQEGVQVHSGHDPKMDNTSFYSELVHPVVRCIAEDADGRIWIGTESGISIYDGTNWTVLTDDLPDPFVNAIAFDINGRAFIGTKKGLISLEN